MKMIKKLCPDGKMSCIRKFKRHIIDYKTTYNMAIVCCLFSFVDVGLIVVYSHFRLIPQIVFFIDSIVMVLLLEAANQGFTLFMVRKEIPCIKDPQKGTNFYVCKEQILVPRPQIFIKFSNIPKQSASKYGILGKYNFPNLIMTVDPQTYKSKEKQSNRTKLKPLIKSNPDCMSPRKQIHHLGNSQLETRLSTTTAMVSVHNDGEGRTISSLPSVD